jgi:membrane-bound inhibitor of C-type lysozyme
MKKILVTFALSCSFFAQSFAVMQTTQRYPTETAFFSGGNSSICEVVTDGCNEWKNQDGQKWDPIKSCKLTADFVYSWSCADYNSNIRFLTGLPLEQNTSTILTNSEQALYDSLVSQISPAKQAMVMAVVEKYQQIEAKLADEKREILREKLMKRIDAVLEKYTGKNISISMKHISSLLQLLKLEIKLLPLSVENMMTFECSTKDISYTVYDKDYCIDDMCFPLWEDELHISDGTYLLPNYIVKRVVSASGEKYDGTETENGGKYTFWFKGDALAVYKDDTFLHECTQE